MAANRLRKYAESVGVEPARPIGRALAAWRAPEPAASAIETALQLCAAADELEELMQPVFAPEWLAGLAAHRSRSLIEELAREGRQAAADLAGARHAAGELAAATGEALGTEGLADLAPRAGEPGAAEALRAGLANLSVEVAAPLRAQAISALLGGGAPLAGLLAGPARPVASVSGAPPELAYLIGRLTAGLQGSPANGLNFKLVRGLQTIAAPPVGPPADWRRGSQHMKGPKPPLISGLALGYADAVAAAIEPPAAEDRMEILRVLVEEASADSALTETELSGKLGLLISRRREEAVKRAGRGASSAARRAEEADLTALVQALKLREESRRRPAAELAEQVPAGSWKMAAVGLRPERAVRPSV